MVISADRGVQEANLSTGQVYVEDDPINRLDPNGNGPVGAEIGGSIGEDVEGVGRVAVGAIGSLAGRVGIAVGAGAGQNSSDPSRRQKGRE